MFIRQPKEDKFVAKHLHLKRFTTKTYDAIEAAKAETKLSKIFGNISVPVSPGLAVYLSIILSYYATGSRLLSYHSCYLHTFLVRYS